MLDQIRQDQAILEGIHRLTLSLERVVNGQVQFVEDEKKKESGNGLDYGIEEVRSLLSEISGMIEASAPQMDSTKKAIKKVGAGVKRIEKLVDGSVEGDRAALSEIAELYKVLGV